MTMTHHTIPADQVRATFTVVPPQLPSVYIYKEDVSAPAQSHSTPAQSHSTPAQSHSTPAQSHSTHSKNYKNQILTFKY